MAAPKNKPNTVKELIKLNDELENYFRNTLIPQLFVDANLILRKFTPPAMKQFCFTPDHIGTPMEDLVDNIRYSTIIENIKEVIDTDDILEKEIQTTDGNWFQMNIIPYLIPKEKKANGVIITFVDITGRMKNLRELEKLNASHETFIFSVTHDLLAPLHNIEGLVKYFIELSEESLEAEKPDLEDQKKIGGMLATSVETMRGIIKDLTEVSRLEDTLGKKTKPANFEEILKEVELTLKDKINKTEAIITYDIKVPTIAFSRKNLRSIAYNLLSNAIKYQHPERIPTIHISTAKEKEFVVISFEDNGKGISPEKIEVVFNQYTRLSKEEEGTGIGLYLLKRIVENAGGKTNLDSKVNKGSTFKVYLPAQQKPA
ncbi:histidine kinase [Rufibacter radiotolerans]|uniref:histidine kinase n=1 Tax=Rufibacter radiotolerans TaxID=1379910 RepID=A0A0H4VJ93_9BACT|nr:ATP-binding protein [Rufibacter radiotolerans]AKQ45448.1 histidine kinase [Rufibacter radiotolerans]